MKLTYKHQSPKTGKQERCAGPDKCRYSEQQVTHEVFFGGELITSENKTEYLNILNRLYQCHHPVTVEQIVREQLTFNEDGKFILKTPSADDTCEQCEQPTHRNPLERTSRKLSYLLRHAPTTEINRASDGTVAVKDVTSKLNITPETLNEIVYTDTKGRYAYNDTQTRIYATQGHSQSVSVPLKPLIEDIPFAYHGTKQQVLNIIKQTGLTPQTRQYVHLSKDIETASAVANRREGYNVILQIDLQKLKQSGQPIYVSENNVILTKHVPWDYITLPNYVVFLSYLVD